MLRRLLAFLLIVWAPLNLALTAAALLDSLADRGWPAILLLVVRLAVTDRGVACPVVLMDAPATKFCVISYS